MHSKISVSRVIGGNLIMKSPRVGSSTILNILKANKREHFENIKLFCNGGQTLRK